MLRKGPGVRIAGEEFKLPDCEGSRRQVRAQRRGHAVGSVVDVTPILRRSRGRTQRGVVCSTVAGRRVRRQPAVAGLTGDVGLNAHPGLRKLPRVVLDVQTDAADRAVFGHDEVARVVGVVDTSRSGIGEEAEAVRGRHVKVRVQADELACKAGESDLIAVAVPIAVALERRGGLRQADRREERNRGGDTEEPVLFNLSSWSLSCPGSTPPYTASNCSADDASNRRVFSSWRDRRGSSKDTGNGGSRCESVWVAQVQPVVLPTP